MAFMSCFTTSRKVWQSQLCKMVIQGGATATAVPSCSATSGLSTSDGTGRSVTP